jgi:hypothetical protein
VHFNVFKQCASHLYHEVSVEIRPFSLAGRLSDPNLDRHQLPTLVRIHFSTRRPSCPASRKSWSRTSATGTSARYCKFGQSYDEEDEGESDATAEARAD